jgi:XTP/dITP diphosphohydrolase
MKPAVLFATSNRGKLLEAQALAQHLAINLIGLDQVREYQVNRQLVDTPEPVEDGATYFENARIKAIQYCLWSGMPTIADDAGLEVVGLGGAPGVHSARFAGEAASMGENRALLLEKTAGLSDRAACFMCCLYFTMPESANSNETATFADVSADGIVYGAIAEIERGQGGFGYDNVFLYENTNSTMAEIKESAPRGSVETHRTRALKALFTEPSFLAALARLSFDK